MKNLIVLIVFLTQLTNLQACFVTQIEAFSNNNNSNTLVAKVTNMSNIIELYDGQTYVSFDVIETYNGSVNTSSNAYFQNTNSKIYVFTNESFSCKDDTHYQYFNSDTLLLKFNDLSTHQLLNTQNETIEAYALEAAKEDCLKIEDGKIEGAIYNNLNLMSPSSTTEISSVEDLISQINPLYLNNENNFETFNASVEVFPNPTVDFVQVNYNSQNASTFQIVNAAGEYLLEENLKEKVNISHLPKGIYFAIVDGKFSEKIVKF